MSDKFVILHLSDAHLGNPKYSLDAISVFDPLYTDLKEFSKKEGHKPNLIVFSGDLAFGGLPEISLNRQYEAAKEYLTNICACFDVAYGEIPILIVPGNHDIDRDLIGDGDKLLRNELTEDRVRDMMFQNKITWQRILSRQKDWYEFVTSIPKQTWKWHPDLYIATGIIQYKTKRIGITGLNSSWASHEEKEQGLLWIGKHQYDTAYQDIKDADFKIAVSHHPVDWLNSEDKGTISQKIESHFDIFMHGHEHTQWFTDSRKHLKCAAGACYSGSKKENGYSWLEIDFDSLDARILLRAYTDKGKGGWIASKIPDKTDEAGIGILSFLKDFGPAPYVEIPSPQVTEQQPDVGVGRFPDNIEDFLRILQDRFNFRWESGNIGQWATTPLVYWPVRLRQPTPIHAAQCFVAAGLSKIGCDISLWIDDLGNPEYPDEYFVPKINDWFKRAGGNETHLTIRRFSEILNKDKKHIEPAWDMVQRWLSTTMYYTDNILKISKIWPSAEASGKEEPQTILNEIARHRPRRLLTPSMVWTCLLVLCRDDTSRPIITLGGYDEKELWEAWRKCCVIGEVQVGHLYVPKLTQTKKDVELPIHMEANPLAWTSKQDIEDEFQKSGTESHSTWSNVQSMIPWTINNCVLLPDFVAGNTSTLAIKGCPVKRLDDLKHNLPSDILGELVGAVNSWLL